VAVEDEDRVEQAFRGGLCRLTARFGPDPLYLELTPR
jgi:hypothetical protein